MKKLVSILAVCLALTSCDPVQTHEEWQREQDYKCATRITKFNYEGHCISCISTKRTQEMLSLVSATTRIAPVRNISPPTNYGKVYRNTAIHISP